MMLAVGVQGLSVAALAYVAAAVAVIGAISVYGLLHVDRRWASYAACSSRWSSSCCLPTR
jgi:uncharacterized membrane protein (DUF2068 family)